MKHRLWLIVALMTLVAMLATQCVAPATQTPATTAPTGPQVNAWGRTLPDDAAPLDQQVWHDQGIEGKHFDTMRNEYEGFAYERTIETLAVMDQYGVWQPAAADRWEVSEDGLTWTFYLRQNAKWSDGTPVTADDWVYSWQRYLDPEMANVYAFFLYGIKNAEAVNKGELPMSELGVKKIDDYTVSVTTSQPIPYYMYTLNWHTAPVPRHMIEQYGDAWADNPETAPSNGPWRISEWNRGQNVVFTPNPYYEGPWKPYIEKIIMTIVPQGYTGQLQMYLAGDLDGGVSVRGDALAQALADESLKEEMTYSVLPVSSFLYMNPTKAPFDNQLVRQAIMHAVDQEGICTNVMRGTCIAIYGLIPWDFPCSNQDDPTLREIQRYDVTLAQDLLAQAGFPGGEGFPEMILYTRGGEYVREAEAVQAMLRDNLGITVTTQDIERAMFSDMRDRGEVAFWFGRWGADFIDPSNFTDFWPDQPYPGFTNAEFKALIDEARSMQDGPERCALYNEAEKILAADGIAKFMSNLYGGTLYKSYVGGLPLNEEGTFGPYNMIILQSVYIKEH